jgi:hypothetical protein
MTSPAMAAGITDHIWELDEFMDELLSAPLCETPSRKPLAHRTPAGPPTSCRTGAAPPKGCAFPAIPDDCCASIRRCTGICDKKLHNKITLTLRWHVTGGITDQAALRLVLRALGWSARAGREARAMVVQSIGRERVVALEHVAFTLVVTIVGTSASC